MQGAEVSCFFGGQIKYIYLNRLSAALLRQSGQPGTVGPHDDNAVRVNVLKVPAHIVIPRLRVYKIDRIVYVFRHEQVPLDPMEPVDLHNRTAVISE